MMKTDRRQGKQRTEKESDGKREITKIDAEKRENKEKNQHGVRERER